MALGCSALIPRDNTQAEIEAYNTTCQRLSGFNARVMPEWADGYLTALAAGPRAVPLSECLPLMCGDAFERAFADPDDTVRALFALGARCTVLADQLNPEALLDEPEMLRLQPVMDVWDDEARKRVVAKGLMGEAEAASFVTGALWVQGFFDALKDFGADWPVPEKTEVDGELLALLLDHIAVLTHPDGSVQMLAHVRENYPDQTPTRDDLIDEACFAVQDLRVWWLDHAPKPPPRHVQAVPGRNEPCHCGSGKKYKRCHGAG